ncbi:MAG: nucleotidyltransferase domain-containing protein [Thermodesulfobacteriota bacterium]|nr:nucleotidyltransferase domain-containing protein [Thermodesulfobacteriota bacterium]
MIEKIKTYFSNKDEVAAIYIFGSYALGKQRHDSDIDIGIIFDNSDPRSYQKKRDLYMLELGRILRKDIHPVILNLAGEEIHKQIFLKGKKILVRDEKYFSRYCMFMMSRIADFSYYKNRIQKGFLKNL